MFIKWCFVILLYFHAIDAKNNVLFIIVDDLRADALGCYGNKNAFTPNIDKLAHDSVLFTNAYSQQALCAPSRNSLLTSRRPDSLHLYDFYSYWRDSAGNFTTIPQYFKQNGYYTQSIGKVFHPGISSNFSDDAPYSWSGTPFHPATEKYKQAKVCLDPVTGNFQRNLICPVLVEGQPGGTLPDIESTIAAINFLDSHQKEPFFLAVGFHKPHIPLKFPQEYLKYHPIEKIKLPVNRWRPSLLPTVAWNPWTHIRERDDIKRLNISFPFGPIDDATIKRIIQGYSAATSYVDDLIGQVLSHVDNNTFVIFTSDHGWSMSEHGEFSKYSNFEVATKVPLLIYFPNNLIKESAVIPDLVELVDLFPTLVDLTYMAKSLPVCAFERPKEELCTEGSSLVPHITNKLFSRNNSTRKSAIFSQFPRPGAFPTTNSDKPRLKDIRIMGYSMKTSRYRYGEWVEFNSTTFKANWKMVYGRELYDHYLDPEENMNLADLEPLGNLSRSLSGKLRLGWRFA